MTLFMLTTYLHCNKFVTSYNNIHSAKPKCWLPLSESGCGILIKRAFNWHSKVPITEIINDHWWQNNKEILFWVISIIVSVNIGYRLFLIYRLMVFNNRLSVLYRYIGYRKKSHIGSSLIIIIIRTFYVWFLIHKWLYYIILY